MRTNTTLRLLAAAAAAFTFSAMAQAGGSCSSGTKAAVQQQKSDIVATASQAGQFSTLVAAIQAAGLVETLQGKGPFTVFAPTDAAFAKLPAGTVESLLLPENRQKLIAILTYHVVPGKVMAADVRSMDAKTVNGQTVALAVNGSNVSVGAAQVVATDIAATNGVIHVIDTVLLPSA